MEGKRKGMKEILQEKGRPSKDNIAESIANRRRKKGTKWTKGGKRRENSNVSTLHQKMLEKNQVSTANGKRKHLGCTV